MDAVNVHGKDGMVDCDLIHPVGSVEKEHAVVALGPVTNIALAIMMDREAMKQVKHIWSMGTGGFGLGNSSPYAEFNVYADPESYEIMITSGIPLTIIGFDLCVQEGMPLTRDEMNTLIKSNIKEAVFAVECNRELLNYNLRRSGTYMVDLPDAVAMAAALWDDIIVDIPLCYCKTCITEKAFYGHAALLRICKINQVSGFELDKGN